MTPPRGEPRDKKFTMIMTEAERAKLEALAAADQRSAADWLRLMIARAHAERFGAAKLKPKK